MLFPVENKWNSFVQAVDKNKIALAILLSNIEIKDFDAKAAENYGMIRAKLEKVGTLKSS